VTVGAGTNGLAQPPNFSTDYAPGKKTTGEGSTSIGFYNVQYGDAPYFKFLADNYSMSDNLHKSVMGGTGANHIMLGFGDAIWFSDGNGNPAIPPHNQLVFGGTVNAGVVDEIENPNPPPAPTTGTLKTDMVAVASAFPRFSAAALIRPVAMARSPALTRW
jgi:phospholipase C